MRLAACLLLLFCAGRADAFLFGGSSDRKAGELLGELRAARDRGDCAAVGRLSEAFFAEKPPAAMREEVYACVGACYERGGLTDKAISTYRLALELYPRNHVFAAGLAGIYNASGFHAKAAPLFLKVLEGRPDGSVSLSKDDGSWVTGRGFRADARSRSFSFSGRTEGYFVDDEEGLAP